MSVNMGSAVAYMDLDTKGFDSGVGKVQSAWKTLQDDSVGLDTKLKTVGGTMTSIGKDMSLKVTAPIVGAFGLAVKETANFDSAMSQVAATMGVTTDATSKLRETAKEYGATTKFTATEAAEALNYLALAGYNEEQMMSALPGVLDLASAGNMDLASASDMLTDSLSALNLASKDSDVLLNNSTTLLDQMAKTASRSNTSVAQLGEGILTVGGTATNLNGGITELNTALGLLADRGIKGSEGGTKLRNIILAMTPTTDKACAAFEQLNLETYDAQGNLRSLEDIFKDMNVAMEEMSQEEKTRILSAIFNKQDLKAAQALLGTTTERWRELSNEITDSGGAAAEMAATQLDNIEGKLTIMKSALSGLAISFGELLVPALTKVIEWLTKMFDKLNSLDEETKKTIITVALIVAAIGPVLMIVGSLISSIGMVISVVSALASPIGIIIVAVGALVAAFVALYKNNEEFRNSVNAIWEGIKEKISGVIEAIKGYFERLKETMKPVVDTFKESFEKLKETLGPAFTKLLESLKKLFEELEPALTMIAQLMGGALVVAISAVSGVLNGLINAISPVIDIISSLITIVADLIGAFSALFSGDFEKAGEYFEDIWEQIKNIFSSAIEAIVGFVVGFGEAFWETLTGLFEAAGIDLNQIVEDIVQSIEDTFTSIGDWFKGIGQGIADFFTGIGEGIATFFTETIPNAFQAMVDWFNTAIESIGLFFTETIPGWIEAAGEWFAQLPEKIGYAIGYAIQTVINFGESLWEWITVELPLIIEGIGEWFAQLPEVIGEWLTEAWNNVSEWGKNVWDSFNETCTNVINSVVDWFAKLPGKIWEKLTEAFNKVVKWGTDTIDKGKKIASDFLNGIVDSIKKIPDKFREWFDEAKRVLGSINLVDIGRNILNSLWEGLQSVWNSISSWFDGVVQSVRNFLSSITRGMSDAKAARSGSFATGLDYVPRTMDVQVHQGERILTQEQAKNGTGSGMVVSVHVDAAVASDVDIDAMAVKIGRKVERELRSRGLAGAVS